MRSLDEVALGVQLGVGLGDVVLLFLVRGEILDLGGDDGADREGLGLLALELGHGRVGELLAGLEDDLAVLAGARRRPASWLAMSGSSQAIVRLTLR